MPSECQYGRFIRLHQVIALAAFLLLAMPHAHAGDDDVYLVGGTVSPQTDVRGNLYAAGGVVSIAGRVAGKVTAVGGNITLTPDAKIGSGVWLAGGTVAVGGSITGNAKLYARRILVLGAVDGNLRVVAQHIDILPGAHIRGNVSYLSTSEINIAPTAVIDGTVTRTGGWLLSLHKFALPVLAGFYLDPLLFAGFFIVGALLALVFPKFTRNASRVLARHPWASIALGIAIFLVTPPFIFMLLLTVIGIPLAFLLLMTYSAVMLLGFLIALLAIGDRIGRVFRATATPGFLSRMLWFAVALLLIMELRAALPAVGHIIALIVLVAGVGAFLLRVLGSYPDSA